MLDLLAIAAGGFDVEAATRAYVDVLDGPARAQSDAYFEGGYWLTLWGTLVAVLIDYLLLRFGLAARFRDWGERLSTQLWIVTWVTALLYTLAGWIITLPWTIYSEFFRERQYDLLDQSFGAWLGDSAISLVLSLVLVPLVIMAIYALIRRAPRRWWVWATGVIGIYLAFSVLIQPVFVSPLFNDYTELEQGPLRERLEAMATRYDVPSEHIYVFDQSTQDRRISANVSGLGPTIRISLNDNLLNRTSEAEVMAVMGHELGHYVLGHIPRIIMGLTLIYAVAFFIMARFAPRIIARYGKRWGVRDVSDPASLPVFMILLSLVVLVANPIINTLIRVHESEADAFGLEAAREPDGFARIAMRLSEYRKIEPSAFEEFMMFDHPSGATRVRMAMQWKADNVTNPQIVTPPDDLLDP